MSDKSQNKLTNKPVTPSDEMLQLLKDWVAPDVTEHKKAQIVGKTNFLGVPIEEMYSKIKHTEEELAEEEVPQLTAEEIEQIRQDAYDEGLAQGKEAGFAQGLEEGQAKGYEEGLEQGIQTGIEQGLEQGQAQIEAQVAKWHSLIEQLYDPIARVDKAAELQLLTLAVMLAEAVIRTESQLNQDALLSVLNESVASLPFNTEYAELHMHPDDIALIQSLYDDEALAERKWILKEEPGFNPGDLIVGTPNSLIDRTVKHRIEQTLGSFIESIGLDKEQIEQPSLLQGRQASAEQDVGKQDQPEHETQAQETAEPVSSDHAEASNLEQKVIEANEETAQSIEPSLDDESEPDHG